MRFLKAHRLFSGQHFLPSDTVLVINSQNILQDIVPESSIEISNIEHLEGIITPGFVNAHCHLELSHLKGKIAKHTGLPEFAKRIVGQRSQFHPEQIDEQMRLADTEMRKNGIVAVGDISNTEDSFKTKAESKIYFHSFIELIGLKPENSSVIFEKGLLLLEKLKHYNLAGSLAPHAPYSSSKKLIQLIADYNAKRDLSFSIHNQESDEETKFFAGEQSGFDDLYKSLNMDVSWFQPPKTSSLKDYVETLTKTSSLLVHNTYTRAEDIALTKDKLVYWCFCPGANNYIEKRLPHFEVFAGLEQFTCLGTDSLASNDQLDLIAEANLILSATQQFSLENVLQFMTYNGAKALGISDQYGHFLKGKNTGLNLIGFKNSTLNFIKKIT
jgi:aminodeoxyfutalosine deaminase